MKKALRLFTQGLLILSLSLASSLPVSAQNNNHVKMPDQFTLNPGEPGIHLPLRATIHHLNNGVTRVFDANNVLLLTTIDADASVVTTPAGPMKANRVYGVPNATVINHIGNTVVFEKDGQIILRVIDDNAGAQSHKTVPSTGIWNEYAYELDMQVDTFVAQWKCPSSPPNTSSVITHYIFNGIEPVTNSQIIQPVLGWHDPRSDTGTNWSGAAYHAWDSTCVHGEFVSVSVNDSIIGSLLSTGGSNWDIIFYNSSTATSSTISNRYTGITASSTTNWISAALESYNGTNDGNLYNADLPGKTQFTSVVAYYNSSWVSLSFQEAITPSNTQNPNWFKFDPDNRDVTFTSTSVNLTTGN